MKKVLVLYPHQLFPPHLFPEVDLIYVVEEPGFFGRDADNPKQLHKQKLILQRAAMRRYTEEVLWPAGYQVEYLDLNVLAETQDIIGRVGGDDQLYIFDPVNDQLSSRLLQARRANDKTTEITFLPSPNFFLEDHEVRHYFASRHKHPFDEFYQWQRERFNILIDKDYKPEGGAWQLDSPRLHSAAHAEDFAGFSVFGDNQFVKDAVEYVDKHFPDNPGSTDFIWPTSHAEARAWLQEFLDNRLHDYAPYHEAINPKMVWLQHSAIGASLNLGLLSPQEVIEAALKRHHAHPVPLPSLELFIRNILGKREFDRGLYLAKGASLYSHNPFRNHRKLTPAWYRGNLGITPFDDMLKKLDTNAYAHAAERRLIAGSLMMLAEIHPDEIRRWFDELIIDNLDWSTGSLVYNFSQVDESADWPVIAPSNVLIQASDYVRGEWSDVWDGLFWRFVDKHQSTIGHHPAMRTMITRLGRLDPDHRRIISYRAEDFLSNFTQL